MLVFTVEKGGYPFMPNAVHRHGTKRFKKIQNYL